MSPIDDELRRTLSGRATEVAPMRDPIAGIEARAGAIHRRRQLLAGGSVAAVIAAIAVAVPLLTKATSPPPSPALTATPQPTASSAAPLPSASAAPLPSASVSSASAATPSAAVPTATASRPATAETGEAIAVYYLGDTGTRVALYREWHKTTSRDRTRAAVELMLKRPFDPDYQTLWPTSTKVNAVTISKGLATVDFNSGVLQGGGAGSGAACTMLQQLVWTVTAANPTIKQVAISVDGRTQGIVSEWWGVGCGPDVPMVRHTPSYELLAPVQVSTYNDGDQVRNRFSFGGEATVFEATVSWSVVAADGKSLASGAATASKGAPQRGLWQANVVLTGVKPGDVVVLRAWESSAKDGSVTNLDTKSVTIRS